MISITNDRKIRKAIRFSFFLTGLGICISSPFYSWVFLLPGLLLICITAFINDIELVVFDDKLEINHLSIIHKLSETEVYYYKDIKRILFDGGFTDIIGELIYKNTILSNAIYSKPDTIEITMLDGTFRIINRVGDKREFRIFSEQMIRKMNKINSKT